MNFSLPPSLNQRLEPREALPKGAGGQVVRCWDRQLNRPVVLKLLARADASAVDADRLVREARILAGFRHPRVVQVLDLGQDADHVWVLMEALEGQSLHELSQVTSRRSTDDAVRIAVELLEALAELHDRNIIHRDVKPSNTMVVPDRGVVLIDFGTSRTMDGFDTVTQVGFIHGTPDYLAPEVITGHDPTPAVDLYAVGVILYELMTGRPLYEGADVSQLMLCHVNEPIPDLSGFPPAIAATLGSALAKAPAHRPDGARTMIRMLSPDSGPVPQSRPEPTDLRTLKAVAVERIRPARPKRAGIRRSFLDPAARRVVWITLLASPLAVVGLWMRPTSIGPTSSTRSPTTVTPTKPAPLTDLGRLPHVASGTSSLAGLTSAFQMALQAARDRTLTKGWNLASMTVPGEARDTAEARHCLSALLDVFCKVLVEAQRSRPSTSDWMKIEVLGAKSLQLVDSFRTRYSDRNLEARLKECILLLSRPTLDPVQAHAQQVAHLQVSGGTGRDRQSLTYLFQNGRQDVALKSLDAIPVDKANELPLLLDRIEHLVQKMSALIKLSAIDRATVGILGRMADTSGFTTMPVSHPGSPAAPERQGSPDFKVEVVACRALLRQSLESLIDQVDRDHLPLTAWQGPGCIALYCCIDVGAAAPWSPWLVDGMTVARRLTRLLVEKVKHPEDCTCAGFAKVIEASLDRIHKSVEHGYGAPTRAQAVVRTAITQQLRILLSDLRALHPSNIATEKPSTSSSP